MLAIRQGLSSGRVRNLRAAVGLRNIDGGAESIAERSSLLLGHKTHYSG
jgi:hypothetical protein